MQKTEKYSLVWFRNDLRIADNAVLAKASKQADRVIGLYCFDPRHFEKNRFGFKKIEKYRTGFLIESVHNLRAQLDALNIDLLVYHDLPENVIPKICEANQITDIYLQKEWTQEEVDTENTVKAQTTDVNWHHIYNQFLYHPEDINFDVSKTPQVFTVFRKKLEKYIDIREESRITKQGQNNRIENNTSIPSLSDLGFADFKSHPNSAFPFKGGETEALKRLNNYLVETVFIKNTYGEGYSVLLND